MYESNKEVISDNELKKMAPVDSSESEQIEYKVDLSKLRNQIKRLTADSSVILDPQQDLSLADFDLFAEEFYTEKGMRYSDNTPLYITNVQFS